MANEPDGQAAKPAEGAAAAGTPVASPAPAAVPEWLQPVLADEAKRKDLEGFSRSLYQKDFEEHKTASQRRENEWKGHATSSDYWKKLDEQGRAHVSDGANNLQDAIDVAVERGVPKELLDDKTTAAAVRSFRDKYLKANPQGKKETPAGNGNGDDFAARIDAYLKSLGIQAPGAAGAERTDGVAAGSGARGVAINKDNIDDLYLQGKVADNVYRAFRQTGQLP